MAKPVITWEPHPGSQKLFLGCPAWECLLHGNRGGGKGLLPEENVLTPRGWTTIGELSPGSVISNPDGTSQTVLAVFPREEQQMYRFTFSDGTEIDCDEDHLWFAKITNRVKGKTVRNYQPLDFYGSIHITKDLYELLEKHPHKRPLIPCPDPVKYQQNWKGKVNAYLIGLLIGNGGFSRDIKFTTIDAELEEYIFDYRFSKSNNKFIPERILRGSIEDRLNCLQGLMDTDGTVDVDGRCTFCTVSEQLATDTRQLILSLGGWATINQKYPTYMHNEEKKEAQLTYTLYIQFPNKEDLFRITRKKVRVSENNYIHGRLVRTVSSIEKLPEKKKTICILVNNPNRLFITKDFVVTHNTDVLLMDYAQGVGKGYGADYKGLLLREATTELGDVISKSKKWFPQIFPGCKYNGSKKAWLFPAGETLWFNYARTEDDYWQYHGHEYPWIGFEELTNWPFDIVYKKMMSCNRSSNPNIPRKLRSTCNPSGCGHQWVKERFINKIKECKIYYDDNGQSRTHIQSKLDENLTILQADPLYKEKLLSMTEDNVMLRAAWVHGSWDLITGGFFSDVWDSEIHILDEFHPPNSWSIHRSFDWGSSKPWGIVYGMECNGEQPENCPIYIPSGSVVIVDEIYGWTGKPNEGDGALSSEIAERTLYRDQAIRGELDVNVYAGPADTSIYDVRDGTSIGGNLRSHGLHWKRAYKGPGSRIAGWSLIRQMLGAAKRHDLDKPHLYFWRKAENTIRTLPLMHRDKVKPEDIDTDLEDHLMDALRYLLNRKMTKMQRKKVRM